VVVPVGGGGLASGTALAAAEAAPRLRVIGAEPAAAGDAARSLAAGRRLDHPAGPVHTVADGLKAPLSERTFRVLERCRVRVVTVADEEIVAAMRLIWERMKLVVEPSAAVALAALLGTGVVAGLGGERPRVGVVLTGGNVDLDRLPWNRP
jgi:threonine dehydratase